MSFPGLFLVNEAPECVKLGWSLQMVAVSQGMAWYINHTYFCLMFFSILQNHLQVSTDIESPKTSNILTHTLNFSTTDLSIISLPSVSTLLHLFNISEDIPLLRGTLSLSPLLFHHYQHLQCLEEAAQQVEEATIIAPPVRKTSKLLENPKKLTTPPGRDPLAMREEEGLGPHWSMLRDEAGVAVRTALFGEDDDRYNAVMDNLHHLQGIEREPNEHDHDLMARLISIFLDRAGLARRAGGLDALDALFWVTDAEWDIETALNDLAAAEEEGRNPELDFDELEEESMAESDESVSYLSLVWGANSKTNTSPGL